MSQISMQQVKELRDRTQAGLNDCRSALMESSGDMEKAVEIILKKGLAKSAKRAGAVAAEGEIAAWIAADGQAGVLVEVNIQTDFAARNDDFKAFVQKVVDVASRAKAGADLAAEPFPGGGTVEEQRQALVGKLGENIIVRRWERLTVDGGKVHAYVHMGGKVGVLVAVQSAAAGATQKPEFAKFVDDLAMQAAAMSPLWLSKAEVSEAAQQKQREIFDAQLAEEGKPEAARPKIIEGKLAKWMKEVCLLEQESVIEPGKTIEQLRAELGKAVGGDVAVKQFARFQLGEGIEKPSGDDFAAEVAKMAGN
ncbi:MAG: translation elongation factor Ts [Polyangiaceae bacterium]|nr:translation elongation factor Ts [Polyangiaceae bacterium]